MGKNRLSDLFAKEQFVRIWLARLSGSTACQMLMVAVARQVYDITLSAWDLGRVGLLQFVPALLMAFAAGRVADQLQRDRMVSCCV